MRGTGAGGSRRGWRGPVVAALALIPVATGVLIAPAQAQEADPARTAALAWCDLMRAPTSADPVLAQGLMEGRLDLGRYGTYRLDADPDWAPQPTADTAGNRHVASLDWILPLLRQGAALGDVAMLQRGEALLADWTATFPIGRRPRTMEMPLVAGKRLVALTCASVILQQPRLAQVAWAEAQRVGSQAMSATPSNTVLMADMAVLLNACTRRDPGARDRAIARLEAMSARLVNADASDIEGSPAYARYTLNLLTQAVTLAQSCEFAWPGSTVFSAASAAIQQRQMRMATFLAHAVRPDLLLDSIGDSAPETPLVRGLGADSPLLWATERGLAGAPPATTYAHYPVGGYTFGRSAWTPDATYYSVRSIPQGRRTGHVHDDATSLTLMSRGVMWIGDPGPFRYDNSDARRRFITQRVAHSALAVGAKRGPLRGSVTSTSDAGVDRTCVRDDSWARMTLIRCVEFSRIDETLVVRDRIIDRRAASARPLAITARWQVMPKVAVTWTQGVGADGAATSTESPPSDVPVEASPSLLTLRAKGRTLEMRLDSRLVVSVRATVKGDAGGWHTLRYGVLAPGTVVMARMTSAPGTDTTYVTVIPAARVG